MRVIVLMAIVVHWVAVDVYSQTYSYETIHARFGINAEMVEGGTALGYL